MAIANWGFSPADHRFLTPHSPGDSFVPALRPPVARPSRLRQGVHELHHLRLEVPEALQELLLMALRQPPRPAFFGAPGVADRRLGGEGVSNDHETEPGLGGFRKETMAVVDGRNPAPQKKLGNDASHANTNEQWFSIGSTWCRILSIHSMRACYFGGHSISHSPPIEAASLAPNPPAAFAKPARVERRRERKALLAEPPTIQEFPQRWESEKVGRGLQVGASSFSNPSQEVQARETGGLIGETKPVRELLKAHTHTKGRSRGAVSENSCIWPLAETDPRYPSTEPPAAVLQLGMSHLALKRLFPLFTKRKRATIGETNLHHLAGLLPKKDHPLILLRPMEVHPSTCSAK